MSRVGRAVISFDPANVRVTEKDGSVTVKGPRGELSFALPDPISVEIGEGSITVRRKGDSVRSRALHGTARSMLANMAGGVATGFSKVLRITGMGYRAMMKGRDLVLNVGFSNPVQIAIPDGITVKVEGNNVIRVEGIDRQRVGQIAASIRAIRPPEPYKGKGIAYEGEYIRRKAGKTGI